MPFFVGCLACFSAPAGEADDTCNAGLPSPCSAYKPGPGPLQQEHELQLKGVLMLPSMSGFSLGCTTASTRPSVDLPAVGTEGLRVFRTVPSRLSVDSHARISYAATNLSVEGQRGAGCLTPASGLTVAAQQQQQQQQQASAGQLSARQLCTTRFSPVGPTAALTAGIACEADQPFRTTTSLSSCPCRPAASAHAAGARQQDQQQQHQGQQQQHTGELLQGDTPSDAARRLLMRNRSCRSTGYIGRKAPLAASSSCSSILLQPTYAQPSGYEHGVLLLPSSPRYTPLLPPPPFKHDVFPARDRAQGSTMAT